MVQSTCLLLSARSLAPVIAKASSMELEDEMFYFNQFRELLSKYETFAREVKLSKPFWERVTPSYISEIVLHLFSKRIDDALSNHPCIIKDEEQGAIEDPPNLESCVELEKQLAEAARIQHMLCPLLIRFWQTVPQQLRKKVKVRVVDSLCQRIKSMQQSEEDEATEDSRRRPAPTSSRGTISEDRPDLDRIAVDCVEDSFFNDGFLEASSGGEARTLETHHVVSRSTGHTTL